MNPEGKETTGTTELKHESDPRYRTIFYVVFFLAILYLVIVLGTTL